MTTTIQGPDGAEIDFPDGTPESEMNAAMAQAYPEKGVAPQDPGLLANSVRALRRGIPGGNQIVAGAKTLLPESLGGSKGFDYGANLADVNAADAQLQQQHPTIAALGQGITGALGSLAVPGAALGEGAGALGQMVRGAGAGFGIGALQGAGAPGSDIRNVPETAENAIKGGYMGAALGGALPGAAALAGKAISPLAASLSKEPSPGPTLGTIADMKNEAYKAADELGVSYSPEAFSGLVGKIKADAGASNLDPDLHHGASSVIANLQKTADSGEPITLTQLDQKRQLASRDASGTPADKFFGSQIRSNIDNFIQNAGPEEMASGSGPEAAAAIQNARKLNTVYAKGEALNDQLEHAKDLAGGSGSGANLDNATRQAMRRTQDTQGGWTPDEAAQLQAGIRGGTGQNILRQVGKLAPSGLMGGAELVAGGMGALAHGAPGAAVPAAIGGVGQLAKSSADYMTNANARKLMATILAGGKAPATPTLAGSPRAALAAALAANANLQTPRLQNLSTRQ